MNLLNLVQTQFGKYVISIMLGLGLASIFRRSCSNKKCLMFVPPDMTTLKDDVYEYDNKCYKYKSHAVKCDKSKTMVQ